MDKIKKLISYFRNTMTELDLLKSKFGRKKGKIKIGWCGVFPPTENGAAAFSYYFVKELMHNSEFEIYAIPLNNKIKKKAFKGIKFARINDKKIDVIVFWCVGDALPKIFYKCKCKKIIWQTMHSADKKSEKLVDCLKKADLVIFPTKIALKWYSEIKNAAYLPLGTDLKIFNKEKIGQEVVFVSRSHYYKGMIPFLQTIPLVLGKNPETIFRLHSPIDINTPFLNEIKSLVDKNKKHHPNNFFFENKWINYKEMPLLYDNAGILVFPSNNEGFGVPLVEAMAKGIIPIVPDAPPMNELVVNKKTGFCLPYRKGIENLYHGFKFPNPQDIADKINYLLTTPEVAEKMRKNAILHVQKEYALTECINKFNSILKKVLK